MNINDAIQSFSALAHEGRLDLFRYMVKAGAAGASVGELADATGLKFGTVSAQLSILAQGGLVNSKRAGRSIIYQVNVDVIISLAGFLMSDCCGGADERIVKCCEILGCGIKD